MFYIQILNIKLIITFSDHKKKMYEYILDLNPYSLTRYHKLCTPQEILPIVLI